MADNTSHPTFVYEGQLLFQAVDGGKGGYCITDLDDILPKFSQGTPKEPGYGFERVDPDDYVDFGETSVDIKRPYEECTVFQYKKENFEAETEVITDQGKRISACPVSVETGELVLTPNENLLFRGNQSEFQNMLDGLQAHVPNHDLLDQIKFNPNYLLWIFWRCLSDESIGTGSPMRLNRLSLNGERDIFGQSVEYEGEDVTRSVVAVASILRDKSIQSIGGLFNFSELYVSLDIRSNGRIHIRAAEDIRSSSQLVRFLSASQSVDMIIESYKKWEKLPRKQRYPPQSFYIELKEYLQDEGLNINFSISDAVRRTAELRGENTDLR